MNLTDTGSLPTVLDGRTTADLLGVSYWHLLELVKRGEAPVEPLHLGRRLMWPTARILDLLGLPQRGPEEGPVNGSDRPKAAASTTPSIATIEREDRE